MISLFYTIFFLTFSLHQFCIHINVCFPVFTLTGHLKLNSGQGYWERENKKGKAGALACSSHVAFSQEATPTLGAPDLTGPRYNRCSPWPRGVICPGQMYGASSAPTRMAFPALSQPCNSAVIQSAVRSWRLYGGACSKRWRAFPMPSFWILKNSVALGHLGECLKHRSLLF